MVNFVRSVFEGLEDLRCLIDSNYKIYIYISRSKFRRECICIDTLIKIYSLYDTTIILEF